MLNHRRTLSITLLTVVMVVIFAACGPTAAPTPTATPPTPTAIPTSPPAIPTPSVVAEIGCTKLNLNDFTEEQLLAKIPNFSEEIMHEFFEYQPYASIEKFREEISKYVSMDDVTAYETLMYVPVNRNDSDEATLMQLPGVNGATAAVLIDGRPFESNEAFLAALAEHVTPDELAQAACYLATE